LWRHLPLAGIVAVMVIAAVVRPLLQYVRYGTFGVFLFRSGGIGQKLRDALFVVMLAGLTAQAVTGPMPRPWVRPLFDETGALYGALQVAGAVMIVAGILLFAAAQLNLGASWRIGIEETAAPGLVTSGLYSLSRHPIFLGLLAMLAGYAAMLPTRLSLFLLAGVYIGFRLQIASEEAYLDRTYGEAYRAYARRVGRFLPGLGKLRREGA
jgi:protein-S-isoprenylcysteine O-methyltransferase Ste14